MSPLVIAIDGPAASGKGTLARALAKHYGLPHLDTGLLYRAVALDLVEAGHAVEDPRAGEAAARALTAARLADPRLRERSMGEAASIVSAFPEVRAALLDWQRRFASDAAGAVLDGRDIGTVVCPAACCKLYVTATPEERAHRRHRELLSRGDGVEESAVLADILKRDARDAGRTSSPLRVAPDAHVLDTTSLDAQAAFIAALALVEASRR